MKASVNHEKYGLIEYTESFWTGKKELVIGGKLLKKTGKNEFSCGAGEDLLVAHFKGSYMGGVSLTIGSDIVEVIPKTSALEWVITLIPFVINIIWGNSPNLCAIIPIIGGAIGGAISIGVSVSFLPKIKAQKSIGGKIGYAILSTAISMFICFLLAIALLSAIA